MKFVSYSHRFLLCALLLGVFCFLSLPAMAQRMPQDSWYLAKEFSAGGVGKFSYPQDVAVGPDGNLYVADSNNSQIQVLDADGLFLRSWNGSSAGVPNNGSFYPMPLRWRRMGRFLCQMARIIEFWSSTPKGSFCGRWASRVALQAN
jgi:hypothetical protein